MEVFPFRDVPCSTSRLARLAPPAGGGWAVCSSNMRLPAAPVETNGQRHIGRQRQSTSRGGVLSISTRAANQPAGHWPQLREKALHVRRRARRRGGRHCRDRAGSGRHLRRRGAEALQSSAGYRPLERMQSTAAVSAARETSRGSGRLFQALSTRSRPQLQGLQLASSSALALAARWPSL